MLGLAYELGLDRLESATLDLDRVSEPDVRASAFHVPNVQPRWLNGDQHTLSETELARLRRNGVRAWLRLIIWEKDLATSFGRPSAIALAAGLALACRRWWEDPLAIPGDFHTCALISLRSPVVSKF